MMVGLHGMAHAKGGSMAHSFMGGIEGFWLNGREFGESRAAKMPGVRRGDEFAVEKDCAGLDEFFI